MYKLENIFHRRLILKRSYLVFCFFIIIALVLWIMIKLTAEYTATIQFTPQIKNSLADGGSYTNEQNNTLYIQAKARGFYIMRNQLAENQIINIDLKDKRFVPDKRKSNLIKIPTASIKERIADVLGRDIEVISVEPDSIFLSYSRPESKKVPIIENFNLSFQKEYKQTQPVIFEPDSITVTGQHEIIDTITAVYTQRTTYENKNSKIEDNLSLINIEGVNYSQRKVKVIIPIERCTEATIKLPINVLNTPKTSSVLLLPPQVEVKYVVPLKDYPSITKDDFYTVVDFLQVDSLLSNRKLRVKLIKQPQQAISVKIVPEFVDFIQHKE